MVCSTVDQRWRSRRSPSVRCTGVVRHGFTLIEVLVVISIVAILIGLLLPAVARARDKALVAKCLANQRSLGQGFHLYTTESQQVPGINVQLGAFAARHWGLKDVPARVFAGGYQAWMTVEPGTGVTLEIGPGCCSYWHGGGTESWYSGIGYVEPYIQDGKAFYCPGTSASFGRSNQLTDDPYQSGAGVIGEGGAPWHKTWLDGFGTQPDGSAGIVGEPTMGTKPGATGQQNVPGDRARGGTVITYFYRGASYYTGDPPVGYDDWARSTIPRPDSPLLAHRSVLTCYWVNIPAHGFYPARNELDWSSTVHGGSQTNLAFTDGHAEAWKLPDSLLPLWAYYEDNSTEEVSFDTGTFNRQLPFWWYLADRRDRN